MSSETGTFKGILLDAAEAIRTTEDFLAKAGDATEGYEPDIVREIRGECTSLDALLAQVAEARAITDEALFAKAAGAVKKQAASLRSLSDRIKEIASATATPPGIGGYMELAVDSLAQAMAFMSELP